MTLPTGVTRFTALITNDAVTIIPDTFKQKYWYQKTAEIMMKH